MKLLAICAVLAVAAVFEVAAYVAKQHTVSPWRDDPYDVVVSFALLAVPMLALALALRMPAWRAPGGPDRARQTARAAGALLAVVWLTVGTAWSAVVARAPVPAPFVAGLAGMSLLSLGGTVAWFVHRPPRGEGRGWRHDWLGDLPLVNRWFPGLAEPTRAHATGVFAALSLLAAAGIVGAQAVGERWSDPLLIGWAFLVEAASLFAFCVVTNAVAGFIARPERSRTARVTEGAVLAGTAGLVLMTAFRDPLWTAVTGAPVVAVPTLVALTVGAGLAAAAIAIAVLLGRAAA
ncbi:hypothetical protein ACQP00_32415 [Dactylosporangium sp. CS-047395]|uniref:hypothetical protein n=1 Tax=Dactylosporangium sp. CS-047395 TaxID=3239936 RepID=UPI003D8D767F